ncbi:MAG TPA: hypothetical protein PKW66_05385 [Polyangiaceae bacterium]|nr:hypothetical protein [Polyangiaceae bacterium]
MATRTSLRRLTSSVSLVALASFVGCTQGQPVEPEILGQSQEAIVDVAHTPVERQSIGNCWLYAAATWVESMNLSYLEAQPATGGEHTCEHLFCEEGEKLTNGCMPAESDHAACLAKICEEDSYCCETAWDSICVKHVTEERKCAASLCNAPPMGPAPDLEPLDISQSYWTYWHWFDQIGGYMSDNEVSTGGSTWTSNAIMRDRGLMKGKDFVYADTQNEMSSRQSAALSRVNAALKNGELSTSEARRNGALVREVLDKAWELTDDVRAQLDQVFGKDGSQNLRSGASTAGTNIIDANSLPVRYAKRVNGKIEYKDTNLTEAIREWQNVRYPSSSSGQREALIRMQRALHARQPVGITWNVDFNALENRHNERRGSFNMQTLKDMGRPGSQGGHMTVLEDYEAETEEYGVLAAGVTLDPNNPQDAAKLEAALLPSTKIKLLRTKNSWGGARPDRAFAPGFPGYHDLWMDYLNGPFKWCPDEKNPTNENCRGETQGLREFLMPPGF